MKHRILITSLYGNALNAGISYYCTEERNGKTLYCDAAIPAEAGCKYILSLYSIDEIIVLGEDQCYRPGEEGPAILRETAEGFPLEIGAGTEFSVLKYRLLQFFDDLCVEDADRNSLLSKEEQERTIAFLRRFFHEHVDNEREKKFNRFFHHLARDPEFCKEFKEALREWLSDPEAELERYLTWILQYLYRNLKATSKLEAIESNDAVRIRVLRAEKGGIITLFEHMISVFKALEVDDGVADTLELYICLQNKQVSDMFSLMNAMNLTKVLPKARIRICRVIADAPLSELPIHILEDMTEEYNISDLLAGTEAFLRYGQTDLLVDYWERANLNNPKIDRIIYAIRNIDAGISLCDIADIERGIRSLRSVIKNDLPVGGETAIEQYFELVIESIQQDYGPLLEEDQISFIELVKWAYRKGFWQQTLTLIESRAPRAIVEKGIYFYSDGEKSRKHAIEILGQVYYDLRVYEKYKLDDVSHYYVKFYSRNRITSLNDQNAYQMSYANLRVEELDTRDEGLIRAHTICPDRSALNDLLFAYYHIGDIRNSTNHATDEYSGFYTIMADTDPGERVKDISQAIDYFIHCYDRVCGMIAGKEVNVVTIRTSELADYAKTIRDSKRRTRTDEGTKQ